GRGILLLYGPEGQGKQQPPHKFIGQDKLVESTNPMRRGGESFVGEKVLMSELQFLMTEKRKSKIYFLQGNGEMSLGIGRFNFRPEPRQDMSFLGVATLIEKLGKENMEAVGLSFGPEEKGKKGTTDVVHVQESGEQKRKEVPEDAGVVVIAGASMPIPKETFEALDRYLEGKGKVIVL